MKVSPLLPCPTNGATSPVRICAPAAPAAPVAPVRPVAPIDPCAPVAPIAPATPVSPVKPMGPAGPCNEPWLIQVPEVFMYSVPASASM
ncbi:MAG: hypothetical protein JWM34_4953 [Ilumatobacteraceae bacterium]|nr:hypothetical protein [Ilumatobacteraceae bacterium]